MVIVNRRGQLGNVLFQYTFARLLAKPQGLEVCPRFEYPGLPEARHVHGINKSSRGGIWVTDCEANEGLIIDLDRLSTQDSAFVVDGFFQHRSYYEHRRTEIKEFLWDVPQTTDAVGIHMRFGDYVPLGWDLPWSYYERCLSASSCSRIIVFTDDPSHRFVAALKYHAALKYRGVEVSHLSEVDDMRRLSSCKEIIMSRSSFSWWAAFLSNASHVYFPRPSTGWWSMKDTPHKDLLLDYPEYEPIHF